MSERTPGPWALEPNGPAWNLKSPDRAEHFLIFLGMLHNNAGELEANARLIAAAPELLCVAEGALGYLEALPQHYRPDEAWFVPLRAAIAKAKGGAS